MRNTRFELRRRLDMLHLRLRSLFARRRVEHDLDRELRFHLDQQYQENLVGGLSPAAARQAALRRLGSLTHVQEECRDMRRTDYLENLWRDLRHTVRSLRQSPGFAVVIILTLALSIGANSAIFSVIYGVLLKPLPYPGQERLVRMFFRSQSFPNFPLNPYDFRDFRERNRSFEMMAGYTRRDLQLSGIDQPVRLRGFRVTAGFFRVLGLSPARGREFTFNDELQANGRQVILSDRVWRNQFGADPNILNRAITLEAQPFTVAGVMPPGVEHPGNRYNPVADGDTVDVWTPFTFGTNTNARGSHFVEVLGRLKTGISPPQAESDLSAILGQLARQYPAAVGWGLYLVPLYQEIVGPSRQLLLVLLGAVGLVLLIACANAANLLLARATSRHREIAVRAALGAGRSRLVRQMLAESLLISLLGGGLGALLAAAGVRALVALLPAGFPRAGAIHIDGPVFAFILGITLATGLLFGLAPAIQVSRADLQQNLREGGRGSTSGRRHLRLRNILVVGEVGLACILLIGAGLMLRSFMNLLRLDPGFRPEHVLTAAVSLPGAQYKNRQEIGLFYDQLTRRLAALPGVLAAAAGSDLPWTGHDDNSGFSIEGRTSQANDSVHARYHVASGDYFRALGIPLIRGRYFSERDTAEAPSSLIINQGLARRYWPKEDPVGKRVTFADNPTEKDWVTVVGIVGDIKDAPDKAAAEPAFWWPLQQMPFNFPGMAIVIRANSSTAPLAEQLRSTVRELDPSLALSDVRLMERIADQALSTQRLSMFLVALFAVLAVSLAAIGIYGVISYSVSQRTHEFGLRMALGAGQWDVLRLVVFHGLKLAILGVGLGLAGALALARVLRTLLFEVSAVDPLTFSLVPVVAALVAMLACYLPARRATQSDPLDALRAE